MFKRPTRAGKNSQKVVKLCENSEPAFEQVQRARFVRRRPYETQTVAPNVALLLIRARYYDPTTGEFTSRDPLEYVDGMSLYRGYFVPSGVDPFGEDWHHLLPQQYRLFFWGNGIDIDAPEFGHQIDSELHKHLHPDWNNDWGDFFDGYENPYEIPRQDIDQFLGDMRTKYENILKDGFPETTRFSGTRTHLGIPVEGQILPSGRSARRIKMLALLTFLGGAADVCDACTAQASIADVFISGEAMKRARKDALNGDNPYINLFGAGFDPPSVWEELQTVDRRFAVCWIGLSSLYFDADGEIKE